MPAASPGQSDVEARLARVERLLDSDALVQMLENLETLRNEVQALRGEIEVQTNAVEQLKARQRELYLGLDQRLLDIERAGTAFADAALPAEPDTPPPAGPEPAAAPPVDTDVAALPPPLPPSTEPSAGAEPLAPSAGGAEASPDEVVVSTGAAPADPAEEAAASQAGAVSAIDPIREQQDYQAAFNLLKSSRYHDAAKAFRSFLSRYPGGEFEDNARYWLGETYYVDRRFDAALQEFQTLIARFPQSPKLTHAMLKVGYIHHESGRPEQAKQALLELVESHPESTAASLARKRLRRLQ